MSDVAFSPDSVARVQGGLQDLMDGLSDEDKPVLETLLIHAAQSGLTSQGDGWAEQHSIIIVGGRTAPELNIRLNPGVLAGLNPQPLPPGPEENT